MFDRINEGRWWDFGFQLVEGCTPVSEACANCWSLAKEKRFRKETGVVFHEERLVKPTQRKKPASYAIWNDLFHESVPFESIWKVFDVMFLRYHHIFLILTKRPERALEFFNRVKSVTRQEYDWNHGMMMELDGDSDPICQPEQWPLKNVWIGTTAENQPQADKRIPILLQIPAAKRFVSIEPMLGPMDISIYLNDGSTCLEEPQLALDWIIVGGESGPNARPMHPDWASSIWDQCKEANVPFFFKQWGEWHPNWYKMPNPELNYNQRHILMENGIAMCRVGKKKAGRLLDGKEYNQIPTIWTGKR